MDNPTTLAGELTKRCDSCLKNIENDDVYCTNCGYPIQGTEIEQKDFIANNEVVDINLADYNKKIRTAGNSLYYLAGIFFFWGVLSYFTTKDSPTAFGYLLISLILAIIFLVLGGYSRKKPLACIISGLCLYIILQVLNAIDNPATILSGIIVKIIIIGYMIKGIKSAIELEKFKKENNLA